LDGDRLATIIAEERAWAADAVGRRRVDHPASVSVPDGPHRWRALAAWLHHVPMLPPRLVRLGC
jgi:hypothetical protein